MSKRNVLTLEDKVKVIRVHESGVSERKLAAQFNCSKTQINNTVKNKDVLLKEYEEFKSCGVKRKRQEKFSELNEAVLQWFKCARSKHIPLSGTLIKEKAIQIAEAVGERDFCASNGWLEKFCHRNNIVFKSICGESADIDEEVLTEWKSRLPLICAGYTDRDIYNLDETGLFFRALPTKTLMEKTDEAKGGKQAKQRLTVALCANAAGEKENPIIIWKSKKPHCFKNIDIAKLGVIWNSNKKAWMTSTIFEKWLCDFDKKMTKQGRNVLLLLDNAPCHLCDVQLKSVKLQFLPPNTTSKMQPLDQGIIRCFKLKYRSYVLRKLISLIDETKNASDIVKSINVLDAIRWIKCAWDNVKTQTIINCFNTCGVSNGSIQKTIDDISALEDEVSQLSNAAEIDYDPKSHEYEETLECYDDLSEDWENRMMENLDKGKTLKILVIVVMKKKICNHLE